MSLMVCAELVPDHAQGVEAQRDAVVFPHRLEHFGDLAPFGIQSRHLLLLKVIFVIQFRVIVCSDNIPAIRTNIRLEYTRVDNIMMM